MSRTVTKDNEEEVRLLLIEKGWGAWITPDVIASRECVSVESDSWHKTTYMAPFKRRLRWKTVLTEYLQLQLNVKAPGYTWTELKLCSTTGCANSRHIMQYPKVLGTTTEVRKFFRGPLGYRVYEQFMDSLDYTKAWEAMWFQGRIEKDDVLKFIASYEETPQELKQLEAEVVLDTAKELWEIDLPLKLWAGRLLEELTKHLVIHHIPDYGWDDNQRGMGGVFLEEPETYLGAACKVLFTEIPEDAQETITQMVVDTFTESHKAGVLTYESFSDIRAFIETFASMMLPKEEK